MKLQQIPAQKGPKGCHYQCPKCLATFEVEWSRPYAVWCNDTSECLFCLSALKLPTPTATLQQLSEKKEQIRARLKKEENQ